MQTAARENKERIFTALKEAGLYFAIQDGEPSVVDVIVNMVGLKKPVRLEFDFRPYPTAESRGRSAHGFVNAALAQIEKQRLSEAEITKVACCSTCAEWFPTTAERNAHRAKHRQPPEARTA